MREGERERGREYTSSNYLERESTLPSNLILLIVIINNR